MTRGRGNRRRRVPLRPSTTGTFQPIAEAAVINGQECTSYGSVEKSVCATGDPSQYTQNAGHQPLERPQISERGEIGRRSQAHVIRKPCSHNLHHHHQHQQTWEGKESSDLYKTLSIPKQQNEDAKVCAKPQEYTPYMAARAKELKEEGNRRFQRKEYTSAMDQYELALKLTPLDHPDRAIFHSNRAACLMQMKPVQYDAAIHECNLALQAHPGFPRALLRRARAFEATGMLKLALQDVQILLQGDVTHPDAHDMAKRIRLAMENGGDNAQQDDQVMPSTHVAPPRGKTCAGSSVDAMSGDLTAIPSDTRSIYRKGTEFNARDEDDNGGVLTPCPSCRHMPTPPHTPSQHTRTGQSEMSPKTPSIDVSSDTLQFNSSDSGKPLPQIPAGESSKLESLKKVIHQDSFETLQFDDTSASQLRPLKLIYDHDIRLAEMPVNCRLGDLRKLVRDRFPSSKAILIKYRDAEGDLVTITSTHDLRLAEAAAAIDVASRSFRMASMGVVPQDQHKNSAIGLPVVSSSLDQLRLHVVEVSPDQEPYDKEETASFNCEGSAAAKGHLGNREALDSNVATEGNAKTEGKEDFDQWLLEFVQLFRAHLGIDPNGHIDLQDRGMELCAEALEEAASTEEAHKLFDLAASKFQEMTALGFLNWGNVYMCAARKQVPHDGDDSQLEFCDKLQAAFDWAQTQYDLAEEKFEQSICVKPDYCEAFLSLGQKDFDSAKLHWSLAIAKQTDLSTWDPSEMLKLFRKSEGTMQEAAEFLEKQEGSMGAAKISAGVKTETEGADKVQSSHGIHKKLETFEQDVAHKSQVYLFWGNILYEHSQVEFRLGLPSWKELLDAAVQKFEVAGAASLDIATAIQKHLSSYAVFLDAAQNLDQQEGNVPKAESDRTFNGNDKFYEKDDENHSDEKCVPMDGTVEGVKECGCTEEELG